VSRLPLIPVIEADYSLCGGGLGSSRCNASARRSSSVLNSASSYEDGSGQPCPEPLGKVRRREVHGYCALVTNSSSFSFGAGDGAGAEVEGAVYSSCDGWLATTGPGVGAGVTS
jgi:hypothetical protein